MFKLLSYLFMLVGLGLSLATPSYAGSGPLGIDQRLNDDNHGIWKRSLQKQVSWTITLGTVASASLLGSQSRFGKTLWRSVDAMAFSALAVQGLKVAFGRQRPSAGPDPNQWFTHTGRSFPSGEVTQMASFVTPIIMEYGHDHPAIYALALLPAWDAEARMKTRGHWQTDVLAGAAIGMLFGIWAGHQQQPLILAWLPGGFEIGYIHRF